MAKAARRRIPAFIQELLPDGGSGYALKDEDRLILQCVVDCEDVATPTYVALRYNELADKNGLAATTTDNIANKLKKLQKNGYLTSELAPSLRMKGKSALYYARTDKKLPP